MKKVIGLMGCMVVVLLLAANVLAGEKVFFYYTDPAGTPLAMTDSTGNVVWRADYKPFGEEQSVTQTPENVMKFVGKEKDKETGLHYFGARYMKDEIGRFISPDPVGPVDPRTSETNYSILTNPQRLNRYAYSLNNPYRYLDPDGKWPTEVHNVIISKAFLGGAYNLSPAAIAALQRGSRKADSEQYQDPAHSYMYAMRSPNQSAEEAAGLTVTYIMQKVAEYKDLMSQGKTGEAYEALGMAMHPLMDNTSPSHYDYQEWHLIPLIDAAAHKANETRGVFDSNADYLRKSVDAIRNLYNEDSE